MGTLIFECLTLGKNVRTSVQPRRDKKRSIVRSIDGKMVGEKKKVSSASALADHVISTGHNIKWDHFEIIATGKSDLQCKIKETILISELKPSLNENVGSEKLFLY